MGYITNFIVYTLAMVGVIVVALLVFKNATTIGGGKRSKYLSIIDSISLGQRKNLYIVSTGREQFLIAGDVNNTTLISKLDGVNSGVNAGGELGINLDNPCENECSFKETLKIMPRSKYMDTSNVGINSSIISKRTNSANSVMKNLAEIMKK